MARSASKTNIWLRHPILDIETKSKHVRMLQCPKLGNDFLISELGNVFYFVCISEGEVDVRLYSY